MLLLLRHSYLLSQGFPCLHHVVCVFFVFIYLTVIVAIGKEMITADPGASNQNECGELHLALFDNI